MRFWAAVWAILGPQSLHQAVEERPVGADMEQVKVRAAGDCTAASLGVVVVGVVVGAWVWVGGGGLGGGALASHLRTPGFSGHVGHS